MRCPRRLTLHHHAKDSVDARLVALAITLEPIEHVLIQRNGQLLFRRRSSHGGLLEKGLVEPRNVRIVNVGILHTVNPSQVASFLSEDGFSVHAGFPKAKAKTLRQLRHGSRALSETGVVAGIESQKPRPVAKSATMTGHPLTVSISLHRGQYPTATKSPPRLRCSSPTGLR